MVALQGKRPELMTLQAGRGFAALLVVLFHATGLFASKSYWNTKILDGYFGFGHSGVEFFFALSGFIMVMIHRCDIGKPRRLGSFAFKRALRIYPIYWVITAFVMALYYVSSNERLSLYSNSIFLIGKNADAVLAVAWTLFNEVLFYIVFATMILNRRLGYAIFLAWFLACMLCMNMKEVHYSLYALNLIFGFGMAGAVLYKKLKYSKILMYVSACAFILFGIEEVYFGLLDENVRALLYGAVSAVGIAAAVRAEKDGWVVVPRWAAGLGNASYSLYLVHYPVLAVISQIWLATPLRALPAFVAFCIITFGTICAGLLTHHFIEKPLMAVLTKFRTQVA